MKTPTLLQLADAEDDIDVFNSDTSEPETQHPILENVNKK